MGHFAITFRIKNDATYQARYDSFIEKAKAIAKTHPWDETTSFLAIEADGTASSICSALYTGSSFEASKDVMVVIDLDNKEKATKGEIQYPTLLKTGLGF